MSWSRNYEECENCFTRSIRHKGNGYCVSCWERLVRNKTPKRKAWQKSYRMKHIKKIRENNDRYNHNLRQSVIDFLGGKCKRCGFKDIRALQVDHVNGGGYQEIKNLSAKQRYRLVLATPNGKYQLLCANCNWIKRFEDKEVLGAPRKHL